MTDAEKAEIAGLIRAYHEMIESEDDDGAWDAEGDIVSWLSSHDYPTVKLGGTLFWVNGDDNIETIDEANIIDVTPKGESR